MSDEELADIIERQNEKRRHRWAKNPEWWMFIISLTQFIVITVLLGVGGWYISKKAKEESVRREVSTLSLHLEDSDPESYRPATEALVNLGPEGTAAILRYVQHEPCMHWQKAKFLHKQIMSFAAADNERKNAAELIADSWMCYDYDPGLDMELYEILKNESSITCPVILENLKKVKESRSVEMRLIPNAALLVLLEKACPGRSSPQLEDMKLSFNKKLNSEIAEYDELVDLKAEWFEPWGISGPSISTAGPFEASDSSWRPITLEIYHIFSEGRAATSVMWHRLEQDEGLQARLIFGQLILYFDDDKTISKEDRAQFDNLIQVGLAANSDSESKFAAISAVANLSLKSHKQRLEVLADTDPDPRVRRWARNALTYLFWYNSPSSQN